MDFFLSALGLAIVLESLGPLLWPQGWRGAMRRALELSDGQLRHVAMLSVLGGCALLWLFGV